jgi:hypothetical protein
MNNTAEGKKCIKIAFRASAQKAKKDESKDFYKGKAEALMEVIKILTNK